MASARKLADIIHVPFNGICMQFKAVMGDHTCAVVCGADSRRRRRDGGDAGVPERDCANSAMSIRRCWYLMKFSAAWGVPVSLFAYMHYGVTPDILTSAKALGGGFPISAPY